MKTEQKLMNVMFVACGALVLTALVLLVSAQLVPPDAIPVHNMPPVIVLG